MQNENYYKCITYSEALSGRFAGEFTFHDGRLIGIDYKGLNEIKMQLFVSGGLAEGVPNVQVELTLRDVQLFQYTFSEEPIWDLVELRREDAWEIKMVDSRSGLPKVYAVISGGSVCLVGED